MVQNNLFEGKYVFSSGSDRHQCKSLDKFGQVWPSLAKFGQVWTSLDEFGWVWTSLDEFGQVWMSLEQVRDEFGTIFGWDLEEFDGS